jgi:hypothetical protein
LHHPLAGPSLQLPYRWPLLLRLLLLCCRVSVGQMQVVGTIMMTMMGCSFDLICCRDANAESRERSGVGEGLPTYCVTFRHLRGKVRKISSRSKQ